MSSLLVSMSGANYIHDIAGLMEADLTVSYEKLVMDNEILGMCRRVLKGIEVNDSILAADLIIEKGPGNNFLDSEHTIKYMRDEFFMPEIPVRDKRTAGNDSGNALSKAKRIVQQVRLKNREALICSPLRDKILKTFPEIIK